MQPNNKDKNQQNEVRRVPIRAYMISHLASFYGVDKRTLLPWLEEIKDKIGEVKGKYYKPEQVQIIFQNVLLPRHIIVEDDTEE